MQQGNDKTPCINVKLCDYRADEQRNKREREERSKEIELCVIRENPPLELQCISDPLMGTNKWLRRAEELQLTSDPLMGANKRFSNQHTHTF